MLGIFRVHGLALIRRFLLAERDLLTFPVPPAPSAQIRGAHAALQVRLRPCGSGELGRLQRGASLTACEPERLTTRGMTRT